MAGTCGFPDASRAGSAGVGALLALVILCAPAPAAAFGSYGSDTETGSAIALAVFGGVSFIPTVFVLVEPPVTAQRIVGKSMVLAGSLVAIAFCGYYFAVDDPLWIPHALGWGIGGGLILAGFITWLTDDTEEPAATPIEPGTEPGAGGATPEVDDDPEPGPPSENVEPGPEGGVALAPWAYPGGGGLVLAALW